MENGDSRKKRNRKRIVLLILAAMLTLITAAVAAAVMYWNSLLDLMQDAGETISVTQPTVTTETTQPQPTGTTSPEETWPQVHSDENITNIMLIGHNYREGERHRLSDTMILCSINRETKTLSMVSVLRDLYVPIPAYAGHGPGRNRINICYHMGSHWTGKPEGGMEMLALCLAQNFGIPVDHSIEVNFDAFTQIIDILGGVEIELTVAEARYLTRKVGYVGEFEPGLQTLNGTEALAYARIRKIDSDHQRTARQRAVIESLLKKGKGIGLLELHRLATSVLPLITTDMTNQEITDYIWELLPMLKELNIQSVTCPVDNALLPGSQWGEMVDIAGTPSSVIRCDIRRNREYLQSFLGLQESEE